MNLVGRISLFAIACSFLLPCTVLAEEAQTAEVPKFFRIPIYYVTDRDKAPSSTAQHPEFGNKRQYVGHCKHDYYLGGAYCTVENSEHKHLTPLLQQLGWKEDTEKAEGYRGGNQLAGADHKALKEKFFNKLMFEEQKSPDHTLWMFVPGYMSTFESGLISTARFAYFSERPALLFSWASKGEFKAYSADEATIEWCQYHFNDTLRAIRDIAAKDTALKLHMVAHSMGTRLAYRASQEFRNSTFCSEVDLVCPDSDDGVVKHYLDDSTIVKKGQGAPIVRLYMSKKDKMLTLSQAVHGGYARLGEQVDVNPELIKQGQAEDLSAPISAEDQSDAAGEGHSSDAKGKPDEKDSVQSALSAPAADLSTVEDRFQAIDFTAIDTGKVGHKIPVKIMCDISATGKPGEGWKLVHSSTFSGNAGSQLLAAATKLPNPELKDEVLEAGYFRLLSTVPPSKRPLKRIIGKHRLIPRPLKNKDWTLK